jgi:hypothetical protein
MTTALKISEKYTPNIYPSQHITLENRSNVYYSVSEFRKLAQEDLQRLLKKWSD